MGGGGGGVLGERTKVDTLAIGLVALSSPSLNKGMRYGVLSNGVRLSFSCETKTMRAFLFYSWRAL